MKYRPYCYILLSLLLTGIGTAQQPAKNEILAALKKATKYFDEKVDSQGRFVWYYALDLKRRWGEMEAYPSMAWLQGQGSIFMGETFLDLYEATHDEYYRTLALKVAHTLAEGQLECGGWNYMIDYNGEASLKQWYNTIGKNGWRLEEFRYYYGNATFDDEVTANATMFLLRMELTYSTAAIHRALEKAIHLIKESQYPVGAWPQRYPPRDSLYKLGYPAYPSYYTFNDDVTWNNICVLLTWSKIFGDTTCYDALRRGMDFYLKSQLPAPQAGWAQQYSFDLKPAAARTYEPAALDPIFTAKHIEILTKFYEMTGKKKYLRRIPEAFQWLESVILSKKENVLFVPKFVEVGTNKPLYTHRCGSNAIFGKYYVDYDDRNTLGHYRSIRPLSLDNVRAFYEAVSSKDIYPVLDFSVPSVDSLSNLLQKFHAMRKYLTLPSEHWNNRQQVTTERVAEILSSLDTEGRWTTTFAMISNPYRGEPASGDSTTDRYAQTYVGDMYDTSPYENTSSDKYLSTALYGRNIRLLLEYLQQCY